MGLKGNIGTIRKLKKNIKAMPRSVAHAVAKKTGPVLNFKTRRAFTLGQNVYGGAWPKSRTDGQQLTLVESGAVSRMLAFAVAGSKIRAVLGPKYAKYLIGRYGILPNGAMPTTWERAIQGMVTELKVKL